MKKLFFFVLFFQFLFSYTTPPLEDIIFHNNEIGKNLLNSQCVNMRTPNYDNPIICAEVELLALYPSIDSRISSNRENYILWRYAYDASDQSKTVTISGCTSYYHKTFQNASVLGNLTIYFRNYTNSSELNITTNSALLMLSQNILNETQGDNLTIELNSSIVFHYILDRTVSTYTCTIDSCSCVEIVYPSEAFNITYDFQNNLTYEVEGGSVIHFLSKPVLHEQWQANSKFEGLVFSKRKFYSATILLNDMPIGFGQFYEFNISNDSFGVWRIYSFSVSNFTNLSKQELTTRIIPASIESENETFIYLYVFNTSYSTVGLHNITLVLNEHFGKTFSKKFEIANRMLSFGNSTAENGSQNISDSTVYRPSLDLFSSENKFAFLIIDMSTIGALFLFFLILRKQIFTQ